MNNNYIEQFKGVEAGPLVQFVKYGISGGLATFVHIVIFYFNRIYIIIKNCDYLFDRPDAILIKLITFKD